MLSGLEGVVEVDEDEDEDEGEGEDSKTEKGKGMKADNEEEVADNENNESNGVRLQLGRYSSTKSRHHLLAQKRSVLRMVHSIEAESHNVTESDKTQRKLLHEREQDIERQLTALDASEELLADDSVHDDESAPSALPLFLAAATPRSSGKSGKQGTAARAENEDAPMVPQAELDECNEEIASLHRTVFQLEESNTALVQHVKEMEENVKDISRQLSGANAARRDVEESVAEKSRIIEELGQKLSRAKESIEAERQHSREMVRKKLHS